MADNPLIKPAHKAIKAYYSRLGEYESQDVSHEGAVSSAFQFLLDETARLRGWILIPQQILRVNGRTIKPDGTLRDQWQLPHGYWEAKDTDDDLDDEIRKKIAAGYPLTNTIFEDSRQGVLFQSGQEVFAADLSDPQALADLLNLFFGYIQPTVEGFEQAVAQFQERIPDLARGLVARIEEAHRDNRAFIAAFDDFYELCRSSLNPNLSRSAVDEMLVQHLLTERLIHRVFDNPDFVRRNVIAVEIEKVIGALTSRSFNRSEFLGALDHFYEAIEAAALNLEDFAEKQHFLNTVYERFFQGYSVRVADTHGIVYTPQEIVDFMCAAVEETLETEFGVRLGAPGVHILDPCTGTGSFVVNLLRRLPRRDLKRVYSEQLFANEVMLMPYYYSVNIDRMGKTW
jgi:predicted helicase